MQKHEEQFIFLLKAYFNNNKLPDGYLFDVGRVFSLAASHKLMPVIYEKACETNADVSMYKNVVLGMYCEQISKNAAFETLFESVISEKINAIVVKGPICSSCFSKKDMRLSSDFDIIVSDDDFSKLHDYLISNGFAENNRSYRSDLSGLYIEVSTELGEGNENLKKKVNSAFRGFFDRATDFEKYRTLSATDHITYLIFHAYKHFIGSGFGIRQLIDIYLFVLNYSDSIIFEQLFVNLDNIGIMNFANNVFYCIEKIFDADFSFLLKHADEKFICFDDFVEDLLSAGIYGKSSEDRLHSASVVQDAVENNGKKSVLKTLFPGFGIMKKKFKILNIFPFLLPLFWMFRIFEYSSKVIFGKKNVSPQKSIEIADKRIELMKKMGII